MAETLKGSAAVMDALLRMANGRALCNCGEAYQDEHGGCRHGCSANVLAARDEMAAALRALRAREESGERIEGWVDHIPRPYESVWVSQVKVLPSNVRATLILHTGEPTDG